MGTGRKKTGMAVAWSVLALGAALAVYAERPDAAQSAARLLLSSSAPAAAGSPAPGDVIREIDDPHTGQRWLLERNGEHPGGPGRLVPAGFRRKAPGGASALNTEEEARLHPVIRAGDRLVVEEHTARADAALEARALASAAAGAVFDARLSIGGKVVRVVALGPGRAAFQPEQGGRP
jgi:hypothetical protein